MTSLTFICSAQRLTLFLTLVLVIYLFARHHYSGSGSTDGESAGPEKRPLTQYHIQGQWKEIRASLGLPPLPDIIYFPPSAPSQLLPSLPRMSRFDLKRKRSLENAARSTKANQLRFTADALVDPQTSLEQMAASFRAIALAEKENIAEQTRARLGRNGPKDQRRPSSWGTRSAKISLGKRR